MSWVDVVLLVVTWAVVGLVALLSLVMIFELPIFLVEEWLEDRKHKHKRS